MKKLTRNSWTGDRAQFVALTAMVVAAFLMGGSARHDVVSLVVLRPVSVLLCAYALYVFVMSEGRRLTTPLVCMLALVGWMLVQLVPAASGHLAEPSRSWYRCGYRCIAWCT